jgi:uncharacterized OB-fold protein
MSMDERMIKRLHGKIKKCSKGHLNGPNAHICWKCGETLT